MRRISMVLLAAPLVLAGCAVAPPTGPSSMVLPAPGKDFAQFQQENEVCKQFAERQIGEQSPAEAANKSGVGSAIVGTGVGAAAGAALGAAAGNPAVGAAIGAGAGLLAGSAAGAGNAQRSSAEVQRRYDIAYQQCMYAQGNQLPGTSQSAKVPATRTPGSFYPAYPPYPPYPAYSAYPPYYFYGPPYYYGPRYYYYPGPVVSLHFGRRYWHHW